MLEISKDKFMNSANKLVERLTTEFDRGLNDVSLQAMMNAKQTTLYVSRGPNGLRDNTKFINNGELSKTVIADKPYASVIEKGRGPVYAKKAKALRFVINGVVFFRKSVRGTYPRPFMNDAREHAIRIGNQVIVQRLNAVINH